MESFLRNLTKQVTCSVCLETYKEPKIISCFHTFCCECLEKHARVSQRHGKFRCPECQAEIHLPEGNRFEALPTSFFHNSLLNILAVRQSGDGINVTCSNCKKTSSNVHYCFDCARFMCSDCLNAHEIMRDAFEGHKVMPVKDFQDQDYEALLKRQPFCTKKYHEREMTRFYCLQCQCCVCHLCIVTDHQSHKVQLLDEAADNEKGNIMADAAESRTRENDLKEKLQQFQNTANSLQENACVAKRGVSQAAEKMIAEIRERERKAIESIETTCVTRLQKINSARQAIESLMKQNNKVADFAENLIQKSSSWDIMQNKHNLKQRFEELRGIQAAQHHQTSFIKFYPNPAVGFNLGDIATEDIADASWSTLEGLDQTFQAGLEAKFILFSKSRYGEISNQPDLKQQIEVLIQPDKDVTQVTVYNTENGRFEVKFIPKVPGAYSIEVKINGDTLANSPFTVVVKERELTVVGELDLNLLEGEQVGNLFGIAVNTTGNIAVTDVGKNCVYIFDKNGKCLRKIGAKGEFKDPFGVTYLNDDEILIADTNNNSIQQINIQTGTVVKTLVKKGVGIREFNHPIDVCLDEERRIVVTEISSNRIQVMSREGETISIFGNIGPEKLEQPWRCLPYKNKFFVSGGGNHCIKALDMSGTFLHKFGKQGNQDAQFNYPGGLLIDSSNNLLVCDRFNHRVQQFSLDGRFTGKSITHLPYPHGIAATPDGRILVTTAKKIFILK
nr:E3 ubiquitin-protein ligase TRIM71-like [Pocillopora verrucosa]